MSGHGYVATVILALLFLVGEYSFPGKTGRINPFVKGALVLAPVCVCRVLCFVCAACVVHIMCVCVKWQAYRPLARTSHAYVNACLSLGVTGVVSCLSLSLNKK